MIIHLHVIKVITYPTAKTISDSFFADKPLKDSNVILLWKVVTWISWRDVVMFIVGSRGRTVVGAPGQRLLPQAVIETDSWTDSRE